MTLKLRESRLYRSLRLNLRCLLEKDIVSLFDVGNIGGRTMVSKSPPLMRKGSSIL